MNIDIQTSDRCRLMVEDATQLFLRLFALVREFIQTAQQFFQIDIESEDSLDEEYYFSSKR